MENEKKYVYGQFNMLNMASQGTIGIYVNEVLSTPFNTLQEYLDPINIYEYKSDDIKNIII